MKHHTKRSYIGVIKQNKSSDYEVFFPDFPSCITAGKTLEEAQHMAQEALQFHVDGMLEDKEQIPNPKSLDKIKAKYKKVEAYLVIAVKIPSKVIRINITVDEKLLRKVDRYVEAHHESRSSFFAEAVQQVMARH